MDWTGLEYTRTFVSLLVYTFCICFYGMALWKRYNVTFISRLRSCYVKCMKLFFGYLKYITVWLPCWLNLVCPAVIHWFLADRTNGRAIATVLRPSSSSSSLCLSVTLCIVAKRCILEQKLLLTVYRKSYIRNWLVPKWMTLTFV